jgi:hypothetical protein
VLFFAGKETRDVVKHDDVRLGANAGAFHRGLYNLEAAERESGEKRKERRKKKNPKKTLPPQKSRRMGGDDAAPQSGERRSKRCVRGERQASCLTKPTAKRTRPASRA